MKRTDEEIREIERHKYFLSEKQGQDVGWEYAERDWERHHGPSWRHQQEQSRREKGNTSACRPACGEARRDADDGHNEASVQRVDRVVVDGDEAPAGRPRGPWHRWVSRLFARPESY
jgi:hypothetical protein